jgi:DNA-3-methyladenine glycosylase
MLPLERSFYERSAVVVARDLLGARLVRQFPDGQLISGRIVETEAYSGIEDLASHGREKRTKRNMPMWGPAGRAYVYLIHGIYWMLNVVAEPEDQPGAVLIRAIEPLEGLDLIASRRNPRKPLEWTSGPARLVLALAVNHGFNQIDMTTPDAGLWIEPDQQIYDDQVRTGPRVGLGKTPEPWLTIPWRFWVAGNPHVSQGAGRNP